MLALRADNLVDLPFHQLMHDGQAKPDRQRDQSNPRCPDELAERFLISAGSGNSDASHPGTFVEALHTSR